VDERITQVLVGIQREFYEQYGIRTDVYYQDGKGALFVREGAELIPSNVIYAMGDDLIRLNARLTSVFWV
jgi:hypothetical protein